MKDLANMANEEGGGREWTADNADGQIFVIFLIMMYLSALLSRASQPQGYRGVTEQSNKP